MKTIFDIIKESVISYKKSDYNGEGEFNMYDWVSYFVYKNKFENWPNDPDNEPQDLENNEIVSVSEDKFVIMCGGDW